MLSKYVVSWTIPLAILLMLLFAQTASAAPLDPSGDAVGEQEGSMDLRLVIANGAHQLPGEVGLIADELDGQGPLVPIPERPVDIPEHLRRARP